MNLYLFGFFVFPPKSEWSREKRMDREMYGLRVEWIYSIYIVAIWYPHTHHWSCWRLYIHIRFFRSLCWWIFGGVALTIWTLYGLFARWGLWCRWSNRAVCTSIIWWRLAVKCAFSLAVVSNCAFPLKKNETKHKTNKPQLSGWWRTSWFHRRTSRRCCTSGLTI